MDTLILELFELIINECGLFVFDEFIDYPEDDTIVITKKLLQYMVMLLKKHAAPRNHT